MISDPATVLKISVTTAASPKPKEFVVKLTNPVACSAVPPAPSELKIKDAQDYILANGVKADTDAMGDALTETPAHLRKIAIEPSVTAINVAVTQDAKDNHVRGFHRQPEGSALLQRSSDGRRGARAAATPWSWTPPTTPTRIVAAAGTTAASAQIVLSDGFVQQEKKAAPVHHPASQPRDTTRACNVNHGHGALHGAP